MKTEEIYSAFSVTCKDSKSVHVPLFKRWRTYDGNPRLFGSLEELNKYMNDSYGGDHWRLIKARNRNGAIIYTLLDMRSPGSEAQRNPDLPAHYHHVRIQAKASIKPLN